MASPRHRCHGVGFFIPGNVWWSQSGSNRRPQACKASALPTELWPQLATKQVVGREGVEPSTSRLSGVRSNHLSYRPPLPGQQYGRGRREPAQAALLLQSVSRMKGHEDGGNVLWTGGRQRELAYPP
jgi:hypothetical protein